MTDDDVNMIGGAVTHFTHRPPRGASRRQQLLYQAGSILCCTIEVATRTNRLRAHTYVRTHTHTHIRTMVVLVWRLLLLPLFLLLSPSTRDGVEAFAFTTPNPGAARARAAALPPHVGAPRTLASAGPPFFPCRVAAAAERNSWATSATKRGKEGDDDGDRIDMLTGSGLRGVDTSKLTGNEKRDADWFLRTNSRELVWFEDPVFYLGLCLIVPVVGLVWGALNCYVPGICPSTL